MYYGLPTFKTPLILGLALNLLFNPIASATGYYNFGMQWKGGLNPNHLGADSVYQSGFTTGLRVSVSGNQDGGINTPTSSARDSSGNIYVADSHNHRVSKYNSSGVFQGWIGEIATSPTGGAAGCNGASVGTFTPGWCTGGTSMSGTGDGMMNNPSGIVLDSSGNIYVADTNNSRINKYNSSGVFQGWIGNISISPTGGAAGCNGASAGTFTAGWCTGGTSMSGTGDGMMNAPIGIDLDSSGNIYVADTNNHRINQYSSSGVFQGWFGNIGTSPTGGAAGCNGASAGTFTAGWCTGGTSMSGTGDGMMNTPSGIVLDSSGNIYVADTNNHRINQYSSSGLFQGWIGNIGTSPTGGAAGCNGASAGTFTAGWCKGGTSTSGTGDGMMSSPIGIALDLSGYIYVGDSSNSRINKYNSSGVFQGWIGSISTSPTSGAAGCNGASAGTFTPGWCKGGSAAPGTGDGMMSVPSGVALDTSGNLYVSDANNHRINKYTSAGAVVGAIQSIAVFQSWHRSTNGPASGNGDGMINGSNSLAMDSSGNIYVADSLNGRINKYNASGVFQGWIGKIATSPTGGAAGCNGAAVGTATPGWCTGGTPAQGNGDGMMIPLGIAVDSSGNIYVTDLNQRLVKFNSSGVFQGWIGNISTSPTGGAAGCNGAAVSSFTPGWCTGGTSKLGTGDGMMKNPYGVALDSSGNIYVADSSNGRISKYNSSGAFQGWIGKIFSNPTGGAAGCNGALLGSFTPGWCTGGAGGVGSGDGMVNLSRALVVDSSGNIYVSDKSNHRINKYNSSGAFQGWIGKILTSPTGGAVGCNGAAVGTFTPGWCTGGTSGSGTSADGAMSSPLGITVDSSGNIYVADSSNSRINKYNASGVYQGWIGSMGISPTGGATGCNGSATGLVTPGWCKGGLTGPGSSDGMLSSPRGVKLDSSGNLYVVDLNARVTRYSIQGR